MTGPSDATALQDDALADAVGEITDEFLARIQRGERPEVEEYARRHPALAGMLRQILPALEVLRKESAGEGSGRGASDGGVEPGKALGDFQLIREIGRGGMGIVYEAQQISLRRRVALKILPFAAALDAKRLERFRNEAQAAARLHHSHIVPVHSVGCERGVYYYAMQYIEGRSLAEVIRELRRLKYGRDGSGANADRSSEADFVVDFLPGHWRTPRSSDLLGGGGERCGPEEALRCQPGSGSAAATQTAGRLSTAQTVPAGSPHIRTAVEWGIQAAEALEHAHSFDVVHRDIKPANLLIDARGQLWVTDFGLARMRDETGVTVSGDFVGTFLYSSPEQVLGHRGAVDSRTDVYSLGATLYELLTLQPAVRSVQREKILHEIAHDDPTPPRQINRALPTDLETILLKALAKDPAQRYQTARELADDLRRLLDHRPILARRPRWTERAAKWARRHRAVVVTSVLLLVLAVIGLAVSNVLIAREQAKTRAAYAQIAEKQQATAEALAAARQQRAEAEHQRALARQQQALAERNFQQARDMLDVFLQVTEAGLAERSELSDLRSQLLQLSLDYYQDFIEQSRDNRPLQSELAASHLRVAHILREIGSTPAALAALEQALQTQEQLVREHPDDGELRRNLMAMYFEFGVYNGGGELFWATQSSVQRHLNLTPEQIAQVEAIEDEHKNSLRDFHMRAGTTEARRQFQQRTGQARQEIAAVLTREQWQRLQQIALQKRGTHALSDPEVAAAVGLSAAQQARVRAIQKEARQSMHQCYQKRGHDEARRAIHGYSERILAVLTEEQQQKWRDLTGPPFYGEVRFFWSRSRHREGSDGWFEPGRWPREGQSARFPFSGRKEPRPLPPGGLPIPREQHAEAAVRP